MRPLHLLLLTALVASTAAAAEGVKTCDLPAKYSQIPVVKPERQALIKKLLDTQQGYGDCAESLSCCLARTPESRYAERLAKAVIRMVLKGFTADEVAEELQRRREAFTGPLKTISLEGRPCLGDPKAPVVVVEFSDFECPFCRQTAVTLTRVVPKFGDRVALCYKFFPLVRSHPRALDAARFGVNAHRAGKFWEAYDLLTANPPDLSPEALGATAKALGLASSGCQEPTTLDPIDADLREGNRIGVSGVPAVYINGREYDAFRDPSSLTERIEEELDRVKKPAEKSP